MEKKSRKRIPIKPKTNHMQDKTNGKLLEIIADPHNENWQAAFDELNSRVVAAEYTLHKGFERPQNPPPNP